MTNIAFLTTEIANGRTREILSGAAAEAKKAGATLLVYHGKYLVSPGAKKTEHPDFYQETAVFDYINKDNADVLLVDLEEICKLASAAKRKQFLARFADYPLLTLEETDGADHVSGVASGDYVSLGARAVKEALARLGKNLPAQSTEPADKPEEPLSDAMTGLSRIAHALLQHHYLGENNPYDVITKQTKKLGIGHAALFLFPEAVINTQQTPWKVPESVYCLSQLKKGKIVHFKEAKEVPSRDAIAFAAKAMPEGSALMVNNLFLGDRQIGLLVTEIVDALLTPHVNTLFLQIIEGAIRIIADDEHISRTNEVLLENSKAMDKDASVLERLGDEDYLTKRLNRRGFFAQAYDLLDRQFTENRTAIVAYIDIDSIKSINSHFGREEGDDTVRRVADLLSEVFGQDSILGRIRGNEFAVLLVTDNETKGEALKKEMEEQNLRLMKSSDKPYIIHLQFSICSFRYRKDLSLKEMLAQTDDNLQKLRQM